MRVSEFQQFNLGYQAVGREFVSLKLLKLEMSTWWNSIYLNPNVIITTPFVDPAMVWLQCFWYKYSITNKLDRNTCEVAWKNLRSSPHRWAQFFYPPCHGSMEHDLFNGEWKFTQFPPGIVRSGAKPSPIQSHRNIHESKPRSPKPSITNTPPKESIFKIDEK